MKNKNNSIDEMITTRDELLTDLKWQKVVECCGSTDDVQRGIYRTLEINKKITDLNKKIKEAKAARLTWWRTQLMRGGWAVAGLVTGGAIYLYFR